LSRNELQAAAEAILFASGEALEADRLAQALDVTEEECLALLQSLAQALEERNSGLCLLLMEDKAQLCTRPAFEESIRAALEIKRNAPLSPAAFEVLAVVAYHQPVTKSYIEQVRGVDCHHIISSLMQKQLIEERGRLDLPGRPLIYGTTAEFLKCFCMASLDELPPLPEEAAKQLAESGAPDELAE
jgi:segregation and condensation protein B